MFGATLNEMTLKYMGRPSLFIACEPAEGGGTTSIKDFDVEYVQPSNIEELRRIVTALATDTYYGGVIVDNASDMSASIIKPHALTYPTRGRPQATRAAGVPEWGDYQVMGELTRQIFNQLINLTKHADPKIRKHLLVTALEKSKTNDDGELVSVHPDLPGSMADATPAMFELVGGVEIKQRVVPDPDNPKVTKRVTERMLATAATGVKLLGDRYGIFPTSCELNWPTLWEKYWIPAVEKAKAKQTENKPD